MKIFIIDDDQQFLKIVEKELVDKGFQVTVDDAQASLIDTMMKIESLKPNAIVLDYLLPNFSGFELSKLVHEFYPKTIVILISQIADGPLPLDPKYLSILGIDGCLPKYLSVRIPELIRLKLEEKEDDKN